jgi:hypothetical protein
MSCGGPVPHGDADILEIDVNALGARRFELLGEIGRAMIDAGIEPSSSATYRHFSAPLASRLRASILMICPTTEPTAGGGWITTVSRPWLADLEQPDIGGHARHAEHAELVEIGAAAGSSCASPRRSTARSPPAAIAHDDVAGEFRIADLTISPTVPPTIGSPTAAGVA